MRSSGLDSAIVRAFSHRPPRAKSLLVTVFGDAVVPHGSAVWIGTLIRWLALFGVNERNVRTAVQRLVRDGWLESRSAGRRSDYLLTETSRHRFEDAERRIYAGEPLPWNGRWCVLLLGASGFSARERNAIRRELRWHGFGELSPTVLLHPQADPTELALDLVELGAEHRVVALAAERDAALPGGVPEALRALVARAWNLGDLAREYRAFVSRFRPLERRLATLPSPEACFRIRIAVIHEFRRILLQDPRLPAELLSSDWIGRQARMLCESVYRRVETAATEYVRATGEATGASLAAPAPLYFRRFGGLEPARRGTSSQFRQRGAV